MGTRIKTPLSALRSRSKPAWALTNSSVSNEYTMAKNTASTPSTRMRFCVFLKSTCCTMAARSSAAKRRQAWRSTLSPPDWRSTWRAIVSTASPTLAPSVMQVRLPSATISASTGSSASAWRKRHWRANASAAPPLPLTTSTGQPRRTACSTSAAVPAPPPITTIITGLPSARTCARSILARSSEPQSAPAVSTRCVSPGVSAWRLASPSRGVPGNATWLAGATPSRGGARSVSATARPSRLTRPLAPPRAMHSALASRAARTRPRPTNCTRRGSSTASASASPSPPAAPALSAPSASTTTAPMAGMASAAASASGLSPASACTRRRVRPSSAGRSVVWAMVRAPGGGIGMGFGVGWARPPGRGWAGRFRL